MRRGRGLVVTGLVLIVASVVGIGLSMWMFFSGVFGGVADILKSTTYTVPVQNQAVTLDQGPYVVYVLDSNVGQVSAPDVTVTSPSGTPVVVTPRAGQVVEGSSGSFRSVAGFTAPQAGTYQLSVGGTPGALVIVSKGVLSVFGGAAASLVAGVLSGVGFLLGLVLLFVGLVRGRRGPPSAGAPAGPPFQAPQGYPPQPGQGYPPQQGQGYPPQQGQGYPPQQPPGYPPPPGYPGRS